MSLGPIELLVVKFPGNKFTGEVAPALKDLVEGGLIRVIDILFVHKDQDGEVTVLEINDLDDDETADLVELVWRDWIDEPRSGLGRYLVRHWERVSLVGGESLVYWLKKLVFRSAWLDHRVKEGILDVAWDEELADFAYRDPNGDRALLELAPVPSWHELQFRR